MPTHNEEDTFWRDWRHLSDELQDAFIDAMRKMVEDIKAQRGFRKNP